MLIDPDLQKYLDDNNLVILRIGMAEAGEVEVARNSAIGWCHKALTGTSTFSLVVRPKYRPPTIEDIGVATCEFSADPDFTIVTAIGRLDRVIAGQGELRYSPYKNSGATAYPYCRVVNS